MATRFAWKLPMAGLAVAIGLAVTPALWAQGTQNPATSPTDQNTQSVKIAATGCLQKAPSGAGYQITDQSSNTTYDLAAANSSVDLSADVGHTVTVSGNMLQATATNPSATSPSETSPGMEPGAQPSNQSQTQPSPNQTTTSNGNQQIQVDKVKTVSSSCQLPRA